MNKVNNSFLFKDIKNFFLFFSLIFIISSSIPILGSFTTMFLPLPIIFYSLKNGKQFGLFLLLVSVLIVFLFYGSSFDTLFFIAFLLIGYILSESLKIFTSIEKTILSTSIISALILALIMFLFCSLKNVSILSVFSNYITEVLNLFFEQYSKLDTNKSNLVLLQSYVDIFRILFLSLLPSTIMIFLTSVTIVEFLFIKWLLKKKKLFFPDFGNLNCWQTPHYLIWGAICSVVMLFFFRNIIGTIAINLILIFGFIYFLQGISIVTFYFDKKSIPFFFRFVIYFIILIQQIFVISIAFLGMFDVWFNFRKIDKIGEKK